jgi:hypothetical protein
MRGFSTSLLAAGQPNQNQRKCLQVSKGATNHVIVIRSIKQMPFVNVALLEDNYFLGVKEAFALPLSSLYFSVPCVIFTIGP